jgi:hypothetical protein
VLRGGQAAAERHAAFAEEPTAELGLHAWWVRSEDQMKDLRRLLVVARYARASTAKDRRREERRHDRVGVTSG